MRNLPVFALLALVPVVAEAQLPDPQPVAVAAAYEFPTAPDSAKKLTLPLSTVEAGSRRQQGFPDQRSPSQLTPLGTLPAGLAELYPQGTQPFAYELAALADGTRYVAVLNEADLEIISRNPSNLWYARFAKVPPGDGATAEVLREGYLTSGGDSVIPVDLMFPPIGANKLTTRRTEIGLQWSGTNDGEPQVYSKRGPALGVAGSQVLNEGKLTVTVTVPDDYTVSASTPVSLKFKPLVPGLPERTATGKLDDLLTLGPARFVVTGLAPDFSSISLAIVASSLEETLKQQLQLGQQMPAFAQVDLLTRATVTKESLLEKAAGAPGIVMVFGNIPTPTNPNFPMAQQEISLPVPPAEVAELLGAGLATKPVVVIVTREVSIEMLYSTLRNTTPPYVLLTDFVDPLRTSFRQPPNSGTAWYGGAWANNQSDASLRQLFNLPADTTAVVAFDSTGKVVFVQADANDGFLAALADAREALKGAK